MLRDFLDNNFDVGDRVAVATTRGIRVGAVERINLSLGDIETTYTVTILKEESGGFPDRRQTLPYSKENYFKVD